MILIIKLMVQMAHFPPLEYSLRTVNSATCGVEVVVGFSSERRRTLLLSTENTSYYELDSVFTQQSPSLLLSNRGVCVILEYYRGPLHTMYQRQGKNLCFFLPVYQQYMQGLGITTIYSTYSVLSPLLKVWVHFNSVEPSLSLSLEILCGISM